MAKNLSEVDTPLHVGQTKEKAKNSINQIEDLFPPARLFTHNTKADNKLVNKCLL